MTRDHAVVTAPGSMGDVLPLLAIARGLRDAGLNVTFSAAERYLYLAEKAGLKTRTLYSNSSFDEIAGDPRVWHPRHGPRLLFTKGIASTLRPHLEWLRSTFDPARTILVSHLLDFAGRILRDLDDRFRMASIVLAPAVLRSTVNPPRLTGFGWESLLPRSAYRLVYRAGDWYLDRAMSPHVNSLRRELGLAPVKRFLNQWWMSPDFVAGLFPDWFSIDKPGLPPNFLHTGFPLADASELLPNENVLWKKVIDSMSRPPVIIAPGTAHQHARDYFAKTVIACHDAGFPAFLLTPFRDQIPAELPGEVHVADYIPFSELLPHAAAIIHHGGVGTTSQAFAAGVPQIVVPMAYDQFDNARRVQQLGCGRSLPMRRLSVPKLKRLLMEILSKPDQVEVIRSRMTKGNLAIQSATKNIIGL